MTAAALSRREMQRRLYSGIHPGLPARGKYMPFGTDSRFVEATGLRPSELDIVVCLLTAQACGEPPMAAPLIHKRTKRDAARELAGLERRLWVERCGKAGAAFLWRTTARAAERLGVKGWEPFRFKGKCLRRVIAEFGRAS